MFEFIYEVHYRPGFTMGKPGGLSRRLGEEKSRIDAHLFDEGLLPDLENDNVGKETNAEDVEVEGIDVVTREKKNALWVVPQEHRLKVLR